MPELHIVIHTMTPYTWPEIRRATSSVVTARFAEGLKRGRTGDSSSMTGQYYAEETPDGGLVGQSSMFPSAHVIVAPVVDASEPFQSGREYTTLFVIGRCWAGVDVVEEVDVLDYARQQMVEDFAARLDRQLRALTPPA